MGATATVQQCFAGVPFDPSALFPARGAIRRRADSGLAADRNDVSPIDVLAKRFAVIRRLVGDESFRAMARRFIVSEPPTFPIPLNYGEAFPGFIRRRGRAASIEYVADIAELEMVRNKASRAAEALPVAPRAFSLLRAERFGELCLVLHPSGFVVASRFPIVTIWENNQCEGENMMIERWRAESALVARPLVEVEVRRLPPGGYAFICALSQGRTIAAAIDAGIAAAPSFDIATQPRFLLEANVVVGIREHACAAA